MKTVLLTALPGMGGSALSTAALAAGLARRGWEVHVATTAPAYAAGETSTVRQDEETTVRADTAGVLWHHPTGAKPHPTVPDTVLSWARYLWTLRRIVEDHRPTVINPHYITAYAAACHASSGGVPVVASAHGTDVNIPAPGLLRATAAALRDSAAITAVSHALARSLTTTYLTAAQGASGHHGRGGSGGGRADVSAIEHGAPPAVEVIRNPMLDLALPLDPDSIARARELLGHEGSFHLLHVSNLRPVKRAAWCVDALRATLERGVDAHLTIVGDGPEAGSVRSRAEQLHVQDRVTMAGRHSDARAIIAAADLLLLPSASEGLPRVLVEAASVGCPAVATEVGGVGEIVKDGVTGRVAPQDSSGGPDLFARIVAEAATDDALRAAAQTSGPDEARGYTDEDATVGAYERLFQKVAR